VELPHQKIFFVSPIYKSTTYQNCQDHSQRIMPWILYVPMLIASSKNLCDTHCFRACQISNKPSIPFTFRLQR